MMADTTMVDLYRITCVPRSEATRGNRQTLQVPRKTWADLARQISLRLERTPSDEALRIEFPNARLAKRAKWGVRHHLPAGQASMECNNNVLFVCRGKHFHKGE